MEINFKEVGSNVGEFKALPLGRYKIKVMEAKATLSKSGKDMIQVTFAVTEGKYANRRLWHNFVLGGNSNIFLYNFLKAIDSPLIEEEKVTPEIIAESIVGSICTAAAEPTTGQNGKEGNNLSGFMAVDGTDEMFADSSDEDMSETGSESEDTMFE